MTQSTHPVTLAVPPEPYDHSLGPDDARVTIVEYGDFECPSCRMAAPTPKLLLEHHPRGLRFIWRHFPLEQAHPHALNAAEAAEAAAAQGLFWPFHDKLFEHQSHLKPADLRRYASEIGLDMVRYTAEMDDHVYLQKVREDIDGGGRSHIRATPTFFINGVVVDVSYGMEELHDRVAKLLSAGAG